MLPGSVAIVNATFSAAQRGRALGTMGGAAAAVVASALFVWWEQHAAQPLMNLGLLRRTPNYLGSTISQALAGMAEMGLGLLFPLLLILNLGMNPALAGLALMPTTLPIVVCLRCGKVLRQSRRPPSAGRRIRDPRRLRLCLVGRSVAAQLHRPPARLSLYGTGLAPRADRQRSGQPRFCR